MAAGVLEKGGAEGGGGGQPGEAVEGVGMGRQRKAAELKGDWSRGSGEEEEEEEERQGEQEEMMRRRHCGGGGGGEMEEGNGSY